MARPRKNPKLLEMSGAYKKNPQRRRARAAELAITGAIGDPPEEWLPHPKAALAEPLFYEGKSTGEIAELIGESSDVVRMMREQRSEATQNAAYCKIWYDIVAQDQAALRVLNVSYRLLLRNMCTLQYRIDRASKGHGKVTSNDYAVLGKFLTWLGQTPASSGSVAGAVGVPDRGGNKASGASGWGEYVG